MLAPATGAPHEVPGLHGPHLWQAWSTQWWLWSLWLLPGLVVLLGIVRLWRQAGIGAGVRRRHAGCFVAGWLALGLSILSPLDALGEVLFWAHMVQHEVVMLVAAPLLVLARPLAGFAWGLPASWRPGAGRFARHSGLQALSRALTRPMTAWWLHAVVLWGWHAPVLFQAALRREWLHDLQHAAFFLSALIFWQAVFHARTRDRKGAAALSLFTTMLHTSVLGALLTFSERPWYGDYILSTGAWGLEPLEDQQLGGLIMWVPGGMAYLAAALALFVAVLSGGERPRR